MPADPDEMGVYGSENQPQTFLSTPLGYEGSAYGSYGQAYEPSYRPPSPMKADALHSYTQDLDSGDVLALDQTAPKHDVPAPYYEKVWRPSPEDTALDSKGPQYSKFRMNKLSKKDVDKAFRDFVRYWNSRREPTEPENYRQSTEREKEAAQIIIEAGYDLDEIVPDREEIALSQYRKHHLQTPSYTVRFDDRDPNTQGQRGIAMDAASEVLRDPSGRGSLEFTPRSSRGGKPSLEESMEKFSKDLAPGYQSLPPPTRKQQNKALRKKKVELPKESLGVFSQRSRTKGRKKSSKDDKQRRGLHVFQENLYNAPALIPTQNSKSTASTANEIQQYIDTWKALRNNATAMIWPFLEEMLMGTNDTRIVEATWSIYTHLIPTRWCVFGPFFYGLTSLPLP